MLKSLLIVLINVEAVFISAFLNNIGGHCGHYEITNLTMAFGIQSGIATLLALVALFAYKHYEYAKIFTLLNCLSAAGCIVGTIPFKLGCVV